MKHSVKVMKKAHRSGMSNIDICMMKEIAKKQTEKMEREQNERAFLFMLAIPLNVLCNDYWPKTAKKRAPKFLADVISLYNAVQDGIVSERELADFLNDVAGMDITADWLKEKGEE